MRRRYRIGVTVMLAGSAAAGAMLLTAASSRGAGPLSTLLRRIGAATGSLEHRVRGRVARTGRAASLQEFEPYRGTTAGLRAPDRVLLGAYDGGIPKTFDGVLTLERDLRTTFPLIQIYTAWGDRPDQQFPSQLVTAISDLGSIPLVTWEPWLTDFESARHPAIAPRDVRDRHGLAAIARGEYDFYIDAWARDAAQFGRPMLVRFAHEMNDPYRYPWGPQNNTVAEFIAAWRHVVTRARAAGAHNVLWAWAPHVAYEGWDAYYPGDATVDWVGTGVLNYGPIARWSRWWSFEEIFGTKYPRMASFGKPVMIAEFGSLAVGGDRAAWYAAALDSLPARYPAVRAILFFNAGDDRTVTHQTVDWRLETDSATAAAVRRAVARWPSGPRKPSGTPAPR